jgi:hypothetical protein
MADEKKLLPVIGLDQAGIIKDVPGHILPPNAFTDGKNVFFKNASVHKRKGTIKAFDDASDVEATVSSVVAASNGKFTFDIDPALDIDAEFEITDATPSAYNGTYTVNAISEDRKTITVDESTAGNGAYTADSGKYTFTPKIDFIDYWPAPGSEQYIEIQRNSSVTPNTPVFNSIRSSGTRERIPLFSFTVKDIDSGTTTPTIDIEGEELQNLLAGDKVVVFGASPAGYDETYEVTSVSYDSASNETRIVTSVSSATPATAYTADSANLRQNAFSILSYDGITSQDWQSTQFAGGYGYVINDGYHTPHYMLASLGSTYVIPALRPLPGWDWQRAAGSDVHVAAKVIRAYKNVLIAGNISEFPITSGNVGLNATRKLPGTIRISTAAPAGEIPSTWKPGETTAFADEFELSTTSGIMDIVPLQGVAMVYTTDSIHSIQFDSRGNASVNTVAEGYGALETGCVLEFDGKHIVIGADDIYMFGGHPGSIQSICDGKVRNYFYDNLSPTPAFRDNLFMIRDASLDEIHIYFPNKLSTEGFCNEYLAWNYRNNTWSINDASDVISGTLGPVRGGGVAGGAITFTGVGNTVATAQPEKQSITVSLDSDYPAGTNEVQEIDYSAHDTKTAATYDEQELTITVPTGIIPFEKETFTYVLDSSFNSGASSVNGSPVSTTTGTTDANGRFAGNDTLTIFDVGDDEIQLSTSLNNTALGTSDAINFSSAADGDTVNVVIGSDTVGFVTIDYDTKATAAATTSSSGTGTKTQTGSDGTTARTVVVTSTVTSPGSLVSRTIDFGTNPEDGDFINDSVTIGGYFVNFRATLSNVLADEADVSISITAVESGGGSVSDYEAVPSFDSSGLAIDDGTGDSDPYTVNIRKKGSTTYSISSQTAGTGYTNNTATVNSATGVVSFPFQSKTRYDYSLTINSGYSGGSLSMTGGNNDNTSNSASGTVTGVTKLNTSRDYVLTNNTGETLEHVDFTAGSGSSLNQSVANGASITLSDVTDFDEIGYSASFGTAATFSVSSGSNPAFFTSTSTVSFAPNINEYAAANQIVNYINNTANITGLTAAVKGVTDPDSRTVVFSYVNNTVTNSNVTLNLTANDGTSVTSAAVVRDAQGDTYTQYRFIASDSDGNEVFNITPQLTTSHTTGNQSTWAGLIATFLKNEILTAANASSVPDYDWYDDGSSSNVIRISTNDMEDYSIAISTVTDEGQNTTLSFSDNLSSDSSDVPDLVVIKDPENNTIASIRPRSGETFDSIMKRVHDAISADTNDGWSSSHNDSTDVITLTATSAGRYPVSGGPAADSTYTDYAVFQVQTTAGSNVNSAGNLPLSLNGSITTQGSGDSVKLTLVDPSRTSGSGPYEEAFFLAGSSSDDIAASLAAKINANWSTYWSASVSSNVVTITSTLNDWILKNRSDSGVTANDVAYASRALFVKKIEYPSDTTEGADANAESGTFTASSQSADFVGAEVQVGHPAILATGITITVNYASDTVTNTITANSAADAGSMASSVATRINSSAIPALGATAASGVVTITTNDLTQAITGITVSFDEQSTQTGRNAVLRTSGGNEISGTSAAPAETNTLNTVTNAERPYATNEFDLNKVFPIVANEVNILAEDFGYAFKADPTADPVVNGDSYTSYVERIQLPIDNSVEYNKAISYIQLLVDSGDVKVKMAGMDSPGENTVANLYKDHEGNTVSSKVFDFNEDYKKDFRTSGRVINYYIEDSTDYTVSSTSYAGWRVSGVGFKVEGAESRGKKK